MSNIPSNTNKNNNNNSTIITQRTIDADATTHSYPVLFRYRPIPSLRSVPLSLLYHTSDDDAVDGDQAFRSPCCTTGVETIAATSRVSTKTDTEYNRNTTPRVSIEISTNSFGYYNISILKKTRKDGYL